jgi:hypothetical protein
MSFDINHAYLPLLRFLDTNGDGTGTKLANGNYSGTPEIFFIKPPVDQIFAVTEILIHISDALNFTISGFASRSALTNGLMIEAKRNGTTVFDLTDGEPLKTNPQLTHLTSQVNILDFIAGENSMILGFNANNFGTALHLNGRLNDTLEIILNDDFTSLDDFHFIVHGAVLSS